MAKILGLRAHAPMTASTEGKIRAKIEAANPAMAWSAVRKSTGLRWCYGAFEGGKTGSVYLERFDKKSMKRVGQIISLKAKGPGQFTVMLFGQLSSKSLLTPSEMCKYIEPGKTQSIKYALPLVTPDSEEFNPVYAETAITFEEWRYMHNEALVTFMGTERHTDGNLVGKLVYPSKYDQVANDQREAGVKDVAKHEAAFALELKKAHRNDDSTLLRMYNMYKAIKGELLIPDWNAKNDASKIGILSVDDNAELEAWRDMYAGDVAQGVDIADFRLAFSVDPLTCMPFIDKWLTKYAFNARRHALVMKLRDVIKQNTGFMPPVLDAELVAWTAACVPNDVEMSAIAAIETMLKNSTDPLVCDNPRRIVPLTFMADGVSITHQQAVTIPRAGAPVLIAMSVRKCKITNIAGTPQTTINMVPMSLTFFRQGTMVDAVATVNADDCFSDDDDDDDDALEAAAAVAEEAAPEPVEAVASSAPPAVVAVEVVPPVDTPAVKHVLDNDDDDDEEEGIPKKVAKKVKRRSGLPDGYTKSS